MGAPSRADNRLSDALSRTGNTSIFFDLVQSTYRHSDGTPSISSTFDISSLLTPQIRNTEWLSRAVLRTAQ